MSKKSGLGKILFGLGAGIGLGFLFAPQKGSETRKILAKKFNELLEQTKELDADDIKLEIEIKINEIKDQLADLDKEKILKIAKKKSEEIKKSIENLYELAKKKATPVIEDTVDKLRESAIVVTKEVLDKLEKEQEK